MVCSNGSDGTLMLTHVHVLSWNNMYLPTVSIFWFRASQNKNIFIQFTAPTYMYIYIVFTDIYVKYSTVTQRETYVGE